jgi:hypothetical protein
MNYTELVNQIISVCENQFATNDINMFIRQAEQKIYNTVQLPSLRKNVTGTLTVSNKYLSAPSDFLSVYSMAVILPNGQYQYILDKDVNFIREAYPNPTDLGVPAHYAIFGPRSDLPEELSFILGPTPDSSYGMELHYYFYPESIVTANETWLGEHFDSALLNGSLVEAIRFMKGEQDMVQLYLNMYNDSIVLLKQLGEGKLRQDTFRNAQTRTSVK